MSRFRLRLSALVVAWGLAGTAVAAPAPQPAVCAAPALGEALQLEVFRNGQPTGLIGAFVHLPDGRFSAASQELRALGLVVAGDCPSVVLDRLPGVAYHFDDPHQQMFLMADPRAIVPLEISLRGVHEAAPLSRDTGAVLNYSLDVVTDQSALGARPRDAQAGGTFEARAFGPYGTVSTAYTLSVSEHGGEATRLDSAWVYARPDDALSWRAGDLISGGFSWTRPVRLGGFQFRKDFSVRPDLITVPTPTLSASAAAPSTLEVMLGSSVVLTRQVNAGPIQVTDLPILDGSGQARLILRDATGRQQLVSASYFATPDLLRAGLFDFSVEAGFARRGYGLASSDYDAAPAASGSLRYGASDALTVEAHAEAGGGLINGGAGIVQRFGGLGVGSLAVAGSSLDGRAGAQVAVSGQTRVAGVNLSVQGQWSAGAYQDLASVTANPRWRDVGLDLAAAPKSLLQVSAALPLNLALFRRHGDVPSLSLNFGQIRSAMGPPRSIANLGLNYAFRRRINFQLAAYVARAGGDDRTDRGLVFTVNLPLGHGRDASAGVQQVDGHTGGFVEARRQPSPTPGDVAWSLRLEDNENGQGAGLIGDVLYRSPVGALGGEVALVRGDTRISASLDGAIAWLDGVHVARQRLDGAFAVADVGAPGIAVLQQNRRVGVSDADGRLLLTDLSPYQANRVDIDIEQAPLDLEAAVTRRVAAPAAGAGAVVRFGVARAAPWGMVHLRLADGRFPPPGARASLNRGPADNVVGYDGQLFLRGLAADNTVEVDLGDGRACRAAFSVDLKTQGPIHVADTACR